MNRYVKAAGAVALALVVGGGVLAAGCGGDLASSGDDDDDSTWADAGNGGLPECFTSNECPAGWTCSEFGTCQPPPQPGGPDAGAPPEVEYQLAAPASSLRYVYVPMTELDSLAKIDGATLVVSSVPVGDRPAVVATAPGTDTAVVLDSVNGTATIVRPTIDRDDKVVLATLPHLNRVVIDPTGSYAVAWFDYATALAGSGLGGVDEIGSFQDVTVLALAIGDERAVDLTVGFRPREVEFDRDGLAAYVVTDDGVSVIDLAEATTAGPHIVAPIPVTDDPLVDPLAVDVDVTTDGLFAVARTVGQPELRIIPLRGDGPALVVPLAEAPADVDLSPDGRRAYATLRGAGTLVVVDVPEDGLAPSDIDEVAIGGEGIGSLVLSADGARGLLFTNADAVEQVTTVELEQPGFPHVTRRLQKSVRLAAFSPGGDRAILVHAKAFGDPDAATTFDELIDRSYGYSVLDVGTGFAKLQVTPVDPGSLAFAPAAPAAYVALDGGDDEDAVRELQIVELDTGVVREVELGSPPAAVGILPSAGVAFVSQRHPLGRISFVDLSSGAVRTVTGFDLENRVID